MWGCLLVGCIRVWCSRSLPIFPLLVSSLSSWSLACFLQWRLPGLQNLCCVVWVLVWRSQFLFPGICICLCGDLLGVLISVSCMIVANLFLADRSFPLCVGFCDSHAGLWGWWQHLYSCVGHQELPAIMYVVLMPKEKHSLEREKNCWQVDNFTLTPLF